MVAKYRETINGLKTKSQQLDKELLSTKDLLAKARQKVAHREKSLSRLVQPTGFLANDLVEKAAKGTVEFEYLCDSLKQEVMGYMQENKVKDSLYQSRIGILDSTIAINDTIVFSFMLICNGMLTIPY